MKFYGKSQQVAEKIITQFQEGDLPKSLSQVFVVRSDNIPCQSWSFLNRFLVALANTEDARGFRQWEKAGRKVSKGSKATYILAPCVAKKTTKDENGDEKTTSFLYGFKSIPVFALESTEIFDQDKWHETTKNDSKEEKRLSELPLRNVADKWGLKITSYNGQGARYYGYYSHGTKIALGVENLSTWTHELIHAADDQLNTLTKAPGQQPDNEIVAEFGGAILLTMLGHKHEADLGGAWQYIKSYAKNDKAKTIKFCFELLNRICACVELILNAANENQESQKAA